MYGNRALALSFTPFRVLGAGFYLPGDEADQADGDRRLRFGRAA